MTNTLNAPGWPGAPSRWTSSAKIGLGTAYHTGCRLWFTLSQGIVNEIYYPHVDQPNTRDFQFLISDGSTFCHEERRDLDHLVEYPEPNCLFYRVTNTDRLKRYRVIKHILTDSHRSVLLIQTKLEILDQSLLGKLKIYALLAPHIERYGSGNSGRSEDFGGKQFLCASRGSTHLVMGCTSGFTRRSVGYVGESDGWQDLKSHYRMDWEYGCANDGNIALTAEMNLPADNEFTIGIALGEGSRSAATQLLQSLARPFASHLKTYTDQWKLITRYDPDLAKETSDEGHIFRLSQCILLAHEDKTFEGALVASMSTPWGETMGDSDLGGYHLVWTRDMVQSASALLASGHTGPPIRALMWLAAMQTDDGSFPQNSWVNGEAYWPGHQLDESAAPILLAWRLQQACTDLGLFDPFEMISKAASYVILQGPVTAEERWEENPGYSPSTLATVIAGLVCAAEFCRLRGHRETSDFVLIYADWLASHLEDWTVTSAGELVESISRYYIRINPTDPISPDPHADPNTTQIRVANGGGTHPARNIVGGDFLQLVRLGIRSAHDPLIKDSIEVIDRVLKHDLPQGPGWCRYNYDGYGQKSDGRAFDGGGVGGAWPILAGERGHYELAAGRNVTPFISLIEKCANEGGMIPEQLWYHDDLIEGGMKRGGPAGSAMPLCWSHAEYISLVCSQKAGVCLDRVEPAFQRYVVNPVASKYEFWSFRYPTHRHKKDKHLRILIGAQATLKWTVDSWITVESLEASFDPIFKLWYLDLSPQQFNASYCMQFTFFWNASLKWEGRNFLIDLVRS